MKQVLNTYNAGLFSRRQNEANEYVYEEKEKKVLLRYR